MKDWILDYGNDQHQGVRKEQQDYFASSNPSMEVVASESGFLTVIADGMGGHAEGAHASSIAVTTFVESYKRKDRDESVPEALTRALSDANAAVVRANRDAGSESDMGTTLVACVLRENKLFWISVGDSRLFIYHNGSVESINQEHSYGAELDKKVRRGDISQDQADSEAKKRNMLTSYLGLERIPETDNPNAAFDLGPDDKVLLCTDGLTDVMSDSEIAACLQADELSAQEKCERLTKRALEKQRPNQDNVTTVLMELNPGAIQKKGRSAISTFGKMLIGIGAAVFVVIALIVAALLLTEGGEEIADYETAITEEQTDTDAEKIYCTIENAQIVLQQMELYPQGKGYVDNIAGGKTAEGLKKFQQMPEHRISPGEQDGKLNTPTCQALEEYFERFRDEIMRFHQGG